MTPELLIALGREALILMIVCSLPPVGASLLAGLVAALFQATTQIQEGVLSAVPKLLAAVVALIIAGPWIGRQLTRFAIQLLETLPAVAS